MQRSFKPQKQGRYLPGKPNFSDVGRSVIVSISPCEGDGAGANPVGQPSSLTDAVAEQSGRRLHPVPRRCNSCRRLQSSRVDPIRWGLSLKVEHLSYKEATGEHYLQPLPRDIGPKARCQPATLANPGRYRDVAPVSRTTMQGVPTPVF